LPTRIDRPASMPAAFSGAKDENISAAIVADC
jgi:hypothetical protein